MNSESRGGVKAGGPAFTMSHVPKGDSSTLLYAIATGRVNAARFTQGSDRG